MGEFVKIVSKKELNDKGWYPDIPKGDNLIGSRGIPSFCSGCGCQRMHFCAGSKYMDAQLYYILICCECMFGPVGRNAIVGVKKVIR